MYFSDRLLLDVLADESFGEEELFWASGVSSPDNISPILSSAGTGDNGFLLGGAVFVAIRGLRLFGPPFSSFPDPDEKKR